MTLPLVAIVGRPNVGKSTLFNRLAGRRRVLVADVAGITRDRIAEEVELAGRKVLLVDTAGLDREAEREGELESAVQAQARAAVEDADAILFVVDGQSGLLPEDEALARTLRRSLKPLVVVVNKIDDPVHEVRVADFYRLGLDPMFSVSAEHGKGAFDAAETLVDQIPAALDQEPPAEGVTYIALVGRPNVGKSSLVNRLLGKTRVVVSEIPGTTRDAIDVPLEAPDEGGDLMLVDTAGLRRIGRRDGTVERGSALMTVRALERADVALVLIDASEGFTDQDARVLRLAVERGCAIIILANKWDLVASEDAARVLELLEHGVRFAAYAPVAKISAKTGARIDKILPLVRSVEQAAQQEIGTAELNRWLQETVEKHSPSMARRGRSRRPIKFFYATQSGIRPPTFLLFCTEPKEILPSYRRFLENQLRARFGFEGTPVRLRLRARTRD